MYIRIHVARCGYIFAEYGARGNEQRYIVGGAGGEGGRARGIFHVNPVLALLVDFCRPSRKLLRIPGHEISPPATILTELSYAYRECLSERQTWLIKVFPHFDLVISSKTQERRSWSGTPCRARARARSLLSALNVCLLQFVINLPPVRSFARARALTGNCYFTAGIKIRRN